jgi:CRISPR-associated protein (TIGR03986 family)
MAVTAPFQFARIPRAVWFPEWGHLVSHDVPFADGYSGTIDIEIEAMTPLLIGGERRGATAAKEGEVWPVQLPEVDGKPGKYAIPGSSLQGMIRNILEIACFGKLGPWVDKRRFGIRDISGSATGTAAYASRMTEQGRAGTLASPFEPRTRAGWLIKSSSGIKIVKCEHARVMIADIIAAADTAKQPALRSVLTCKNTADLRAAAYLAAFRDFKTSITPTNLQPHEHSAPRPDRPRIWIKYRRATLGGGTAATMVLTGKPQDRIDADKKKKWEFSFYAPDCVTAKAPGQPFIPVTDEIWNDFKLIHEPPKGSGQAENPNWMYWKNVFEYGEPVPIFYIEQVDASNNPINGTIAAMGTAFMFKLAHKNDTHQTLKNSSATHVDNKTDYDLASLILGGIGSESDGWFGHSLKRRASFDWAMADSTAQSVQAQYANQTGDIEQDGHKSPPTPPANATVLLGPKPSYYAIYVRQPVRQGNQLNRGNNHRVNESFATYTPSITGEAAKTTPELSGIKIWPVSSQSRFFNLPRAPIKSGDNPQKDPSSKATHVHLHALPKATKFNTTLHVHNLRASELGALLWALTLGDEQSLQGKCGKLHHRIGMGKPYGMGEMALRIRSFILDRNDGEPSDDILAGCIAAFKKTMNTACVTLAQKSGKKWLKDGKPSSTDPVLWSETVQVKALEKAADPSRYEATSYMKLADFIAGKNEGHFLPPLADEWCELASPSGAPAQQGGNNHGGNHNPPPQASPPYNGPELAPIKGATVQYGPRQGKIIYVGNGKARIKLTDGTEHSVPIGKNLFTVIAVP